MKVLVHATRGNLSQGGVLFYGDPNSYEDKDKGKFGLRYASARTVRVVSELDTISALFRVSSPLYTSCNPPVGISRIV